MLVLDELFLPRSLPFDEADEVELGAKRKIKSRGGNLKEEKEVAGREVLQIFVLELREECFKTVWNSSCKF